MKALLLAVPLTVSCAFAAELDNVTGWSTTRDALPKFAPVPVVKKNAK